MLVTGAMVEWAGFRLTVAVMASGYPLLGPSLFAVRALRGMDTKLGT